VSDEPNPLAEIFSRFAEYLNDAPYAKRLARLAKTATRTPDRLLDDVTELIVQLDDVPLVGNDISVHLLDVAYCDAKYANAIAFTSALRLRLQDYVDNPDVAASARGNLTGRVGWWRFALSRSGELCKWPAMILVKDMR
jgi:hypothetical protein